MNCRNFKIYLVYLIISSAYFIQFPLIHSLTGDIDTIGNLAMFKHLKMFIDVKLGLRDTLPQYLYPIENTWILFGADFGSGIIHIIFNYLGFNDLWANFFYIAILFSLNSFCIYLFLSYIIKNENLIAFILSLIFSFSHFSLANLENPNVLIFFPSFLSLLFLLKYLDYDRLKYLYISIIIGGFLIYLSPTNFLMHQLLYFLIILFYRNDIKAQIKVKSIIYTLIITIILISPYVWYYIINYPGVPYEKNEIMYRFSLNLEDFIRVLPGHLYFSAQEHQQGVDFWLFKIKSAYLGVMFYILVIFSFFRVRNNLLWKFLFFAGLIISMGPYIYMNGKYLFPNLVYPFFSYLDLGRYITVPSRYFFISIISGVILIALMYNQENSKKVKIVILLSLFVVILENIPLKMEKYTKSYKDELMIDDKLHSTLSESSFKNILFASTYKDAAIDIRREYIYMYWQYRLNKNILNGFTAVLSKEVIDLTERRRDLTVENIKYLIDNHDLDAIVVFKGVGNRINDYQYLNNQTEILKRYFENKDFIIYEKEG